MNPNKAPGPDGFTALFVQNCRDTIKLDFQADVCAVQNLSSNQLHRLNVATMVLIAKSPEAFSPREFRPINLIGIFAKTMMKILALLRLKPKMNELVSPCQNAFIKGRVIHDSFTYVRSLARAFRQAKTPALMIKLDIEKAFDSVSWEFLLELLKKLGFGQRWRNWLSMLLSSASTRILINASFSEILKHKRGLRQGDPLLPLLFTLVMDCLADILSAAVSSGLLKPMGSFHMPFRTFLYADDAVIFINPVEDEVLAVSELLNVFAEATRLRTNFEKSSITP
jgi:hypothetical protein